MPAVTPVHVASVNVEPAARSKLITPVVGWARLGAVPGLSVNTSISNVVGVVPVLMGKVKEKVTVLAGVVVVNS